MKQIVLRSAIAVAMACTVCGVEPVCAQDVLPPQPPINPDAVAEPQAPQADNQGGDATPTVISIAQPEEEDALEPSEGQDDLISITLDDVPLVDVIRMFTRISGANIIADAAELQGSVTVNLQDVKWKPALMSILDMHDLALVEKQIGSDVYSVVPRPLDAPVPMITKSFTLKFATVSDISPIVRNMLAEGATMSDFASRNMLVVRSTAENLNDINEIIIEVDKPTKQVCIETKFMELTDAATSQLGIRWDSLAEFGVRLQAGPFTWNRDTSDSFTRSDSRTRWDRRSQTDSINEMYDMGGVQIEDSDFSLFDDDDNPETAPRVITEVVPTRNVSDTIDRGVNYEQSIVNQFSRNIEQTQTAILEMDQFQVILSALKTTDGVTLVSNPKMIVANGATNAMFSVGSREPIIRTEITRGTQDSPGDILTAQLDTSVNTDYITQGYLATGIDLRVVPVVKTDDLIEAEIMPSLRRKTGNKEVGNNSWPLISVKEIRTRFTLQSGQTVAIGGLTDTTDQKETSKVPLLGDIPLLGKYLFSHTRDVKRQLETIIFVTLSLATPEKLFKNTGIPEQAELVHRRMIREELQRQNLEAGLEELREASDEAQRDKSSKARSRLLRRRR